MVPLAPAGPTRPGDVIDAHTHLFSLPLLQEYVDAHPEENARFRQAVKEKRFGRRGEALPDLAPDAMARFYVERIEAAGVARAVVMSVVPDSSYTRDFITAANGHVHALCSIDPREPRAPAMLELEMAAGFRGVKLLPVNRKYRLSDEACRPLFEKASELGAAIVVHYGVTVDPTGDLRYADPLDLSPVARDFPDVTFVIAHFGAGFFTQVLQLAYQCKNVCVDSSGTNNWIDYDPHGYTLAQVFERSLVALGPERVLFGTDAGTTAPYREWIKFQQLRTLEELGLSEGDRDLIARGNAVRIFRLEG
ncbi:MAG: amidohydrolase family protein [Coriobacteriia bacterium]